MRFGRYRRGFAKYCLIAAIVLTGCSGEKSPKDFNKEGLEFFKEGKYEEAKESLSEAVKGNPDKAEYYIDYGMSLVKTNEFEEAFIQFDKAILKNNNKIVRENNKRAYRGRGIAFFEQAKYSEAVVEFGKALDISELDELDTDILYYVGEAEEKSGNYGEAEKAYKKILSKNQSDPIIYGKLGQAQEKNGDYAAALKNYDKAISLDETNYNLYFGKYFLLLNSGNEAEANEVLTKALGIKTKTDEDFYNLARLHYYNGEFDKAESELEEAASKGFTSSYYYLGRIHQNNKDYDSAISMYELYLEDQNNPKSAILYNQLGVCYIEKKEYEKALEYIQNGVSLNDESASYNLLSNEITTLEHLADYEKAYKKATKFLELYPDDESMLKELEYIKTRRSEKEAETEESKSEDKNSKESDKTESDKKEE